MDSADDLSGYMPIRTASTWDYSVGPLRCSLVRGLFRRQLYLGLISGLGPLTPVVGSGSASPASHVPCRSTKARVQSSFVLRIQTGGGALFWFRRMDFGVLDTPCSDMPELGVRDPGIRAVV